jgi:PAS domain S-box-containing protein
MIRSPIPETWLRPGNMHPALGYALAVASVGLALLFQLSLGLLAYRIPFLPFHVAVAAAAWFGGLRPGLLATFLSAAAAAYFFLEPVNNFDLRNGETDIQLAIFLVVALAITGMAYVGRQANNRVYEERGKLEATLSSIGDAALATDTDGKVTFINPVAETLTGWAHRDAIGQPIERILKVVNEETHAPIENLVRRVLRDGKAEGLANHTILIAKDGTERPIEDSAAPIHDYRGRIIGMVMVFRDVTQRREEELTRERLLAQVEVERTRMNDLMATVPGVVWEAWGKPDESSQHIDFVSPYAEEMLGYTREEWLSTHNFWLSIVHPDDKEAAAKVAADRFASGENGTNRFRWITKDGRVLWIETRDVITKDGNGKPIGMRGVSMDVSERKELEDTVREQSEAQQAMLKTMVEGMPIGLALLDKNACILSLNPQWARMTNTGEDSVGKPIYILSSAFAERKPLYERVFAGESLDLSDIPYNIPGDDTTYYRDIHLRPVRNSSGAVVGMLNAVIDVTERYALDQQKDALLALASHELKTPITTIKGYSQLALRATSQLGDEKLRRTLRTIDEQANRLTRLVNEMLEVSRIQSDTLPLHEDQVDICELVRDVVESLATTAPEFTIDIDVEKSPVMVFIDRQRIEQVITNLVQNAIKYSGDSRKIEVTTQIDDTGNYILVSVRDYGVGIPTDQQNQVFMRFFRARNVFATSYTGLGLGLYISHEIVTRHGGRLWLESEEGEGSTFYFTLPIDKDPVPDLSGQQNG